MGSMLEKIRGLEAQNRHLERWNRKLREKAKDMEELEAGTRWMLGAQLAAAIVAHGENAGTEERPAWRLTLPAELVTDGLYRYSIHTRMDGDGKNYIHEVTIREDWKE